MERPDIRRRALDGAFELGNRLLELPRGRERGAETEVSFEVFGVEKDRLLRLAERLRVLSVFQVCQRESASGLGPLGKRRDETDEQAFRRRPLAHIQEGLREREGDFSVAGVL